MKERNAGLDLCRILAMLGIVVLHIIGQGGAQRIVNGEYTVRYWLVEILYICALCSVDVFALMSGYFGISSKKATIYRALELIATVLFFSALATACFAVLEPEKILNWRALLKGIVPAMADRYWYITCYLPILFLQPYLNKMLLAISEKQHRALCMMSVGLFSVLPTLLTVDFFRFKQGYSFVWLLCLYVLGAYLKRSKIDTAQLRKRYLLLAFVGITGVLLGGNFFVKTVLGANYRYFVAYTSPLTLGMSICAFLLLKNLHIARGTRLLQKLGMVAFDVYIIHSHIFVFDMLLAGAFAWVNNLAIWWTLPLVLAGAIGIYAVCAVLGLARSALFSVTRCNVLLSKIAQKADRLFYGDFSNS